MPKIFQRLFEQCGRRLEDYVSIRKLPLQIRNVYPDGTVIDLYESIEDTLIQNKHLSSNDMTQLKTFLSMLIKFIIKLNAVISIKV